MQPMQFQPFPQESAQQPSSRSGVRPLPGSLKLILGLKAIGCLLTAFLSMIALMAFDDIKTLPEGMSVAMAHQLAQSSMFAAGVSVVELLGVAGTWTFKRWALGGDTAGPPTDLLRRWEREPWPGNVRELRNTIARHIALGDLAPAPDAPSAPPGRARDVIEEVIAEGLPFVRAREKVVDAFQRRYLEHVLEAAGGDTAKAAATSGIARRYFNLLRARLK